MRAKAEGTVRVAHRLRRCISVMVIGSLAVTAAVIVPTMDATGSPTTPTLYVVDAATPPSSAPGLVPVRLSNGTRQAPVPVGAAPAAVATSPDAKKAFVVNTGGNSVTPINLETGQAGGAISVGVRPVAVAVTPDGATAYVVNEGSGTLTAIDVASNTVDVARSVFVGPSPTAIAISPDGTTAWVTVSGVNVVWVSLVNAKVSAPIPVGNDPRAIAITPDAKTVYVANRGDDTVTPITVATLQTLPAIGVGDAPTAIAVTPDGKAAFVANSGTATTPVASPSLSKLNLVANTVAATIPLASGPAALTITPDGASVYAALRDVGKVQPVPVAGPWGSLPAALDGFGRPTAVVVSPDQAPTARLATSLPECGQKPYYASFQVCITSGDSVSFDASASTAATTPIASYTWEFGDGSPRQTTSGSVVSHTYTTAGSYLAAVIVTDTAGTSTDRVFTGQTMSRNGGPGAVAYAIVNVSAPANATPINTPLLYVADGAQVKPVALPPDGPPTVGNPFPAGRGPYFPAVTPDGRAVVTPNFVSNDVTVAAVCPNGSSLSFSPGNSVPVGVNPTSVAIAPRALSSSGGTSTYLAYVANWGGAEIRQLLVTVTSSPCAATVSLVANGTIPVGSGPYGIALTDDGGRAYVTVTSLNAIVPVDLPTVATGATSPGDAGGLKLPSATTPRSAPVVGAPIPVGLFPTRIVLAPDGDTAYVTNRSSNSVSPVDLSARSVGEPIAVGGYPLDLAMAPDGSRLVVTNSGTSSVTVISLGSAPPVTSTIPVDGLPFGVAITPDGKKAYVSLQMPANTVVPLTFGVGVSATTGTAITGFAAALGVVASPDQGPTARIRTSTNSVTDEACGGGGSGEVVSFTVCVQRGTAVEFDAGASTRGTTAIRDYRWNFGDGSPAVTTSGSVVSHVYASPGTYTASVTVTDVAGTSTSLVFTGQTVSRNGSSRATDKGDIIVIAPPVPVDTPLLYVATGPKVTPVATPPGGPAQLGNGFATGNAAFYPAVTPDGRAVVTPNREANSVTATAVCRDGTRLKFVTSATAGTVGVGRYPTSVAIRPTPIGRIEVPAPADVYAVYVTDFGSGEVRELKLTVYTTTCGATIEAEHNNIIPVGPDPYGIVVREQKAPDGTVTTATAYVTVSGLDAVVPIDLVAKRPGLRIDLGSGTPSALCKLCPRRIALSADGTTAYVANREPTSTPSGDVNTVSRINLDTNQALTPIQLTKPGGGYPLDLVVRGTRAYVTNSGGHTVSVLDLVTDLEVAAIDLGTALPRGIALTPDGGTMYVSSWDPAHALIPITIGGLPAAPSYTVGALIRGLTYPQGIVASQGPAPFGLG